MLVSDLAYRDMEDRSDNAMRRVSGFFRRLFGGSSHEPATNPFQFAPEHQAHLRLVSTPNPSHDEDVPRVDAADSFRWRRHPQLLNHAEGPMVQSEESGRSARSASIRGLFLARSGRSEEARDAFAQAAADPAIDLTAVPGFWDLSRSGMLAAVGAYEDVERYRDASALGARIRLMYRPRAVSSLPVVEPRPKAASGD